MKFISSIQVRTSVEKGDENDLVLCQCVLQQEVLPDVPNGVNDLGIEELVISEGNEIHSRQNLRICDITVFGASKDVIWYELLKLLTGHKLQFEELNGKIDYSSWVCYAPERGRWQLVMELESAGLVKKLAQLDLDMVDSGEVDMFQFTNILFRQWCYSNDQLHQARWEIAEKSRAVEALKTEREELNSLLLSRDKKTRTVVVELLNEKKKMIRNLYNEIDRLQSSSTTVVPKLRRVPDSDVVNSHVSKPVLYLTSPGKRRKRESGSSTPPVPKRQLREDLVKMVPKSDDFEDFQFFGITKPTQDSNAPTRSRTSSPAKKAIKQESKDSSSSAAETDSQERPHHNCHDGSSACSDERKPRASAIKTEDTSESETDAETVKCFANDYSEDSNAETEAETELESE